MGCYDPIERDLARASDARESLAADIARLRDELVSLMDALRDRATRDPATVTSVRARIAPLLARSFGGRFSWGDLPPVPGTEEAPGGPWPDFSAVNALLSDAESTRRSLERALCELRGALAGDDDAIRARQIAHRHDDRDAWLGHAELHLDVLRLALDLGDVPAAEVAAWEACIATVRSLMDEALLADDALPPIPGVASR